MGWDGYACRVRYDDFFQHDLLERLSHAEAAHFGFWDSDNETRAVSSSRPSASLSSRTSAKALAQATGDNPYNTEWWPDQVKELAKKANWDFEVEADAVEHKEEVKLFLNLCAKHNFGIRFD